MARGIPSKTLIKFFISVVTGTSQAVVMILGRTSEFHGWIF